MSNVDKFYCLVKAIESLEIGLYFLKKSEVQGYDFESTIQKLKLEKEKYISKIEIDEFILRERYKSGNNN